MISLIRMQIHRRFLIVTLLLFFVLTILLIQFYKMQVIEGEKWEKLAKKQHFFVVKERAHRGIFYSNPVVKKGHPEKIQPFVLDIEKFHLHIDPLSIPSEQREMIIRSLISQLKLTKNEKKSLYNQFEKKSRNRRIAKWLSSDMHDRIDSWWMEYSRKHRIPRNALFFVSDYQRSYPFGKLLGQVLHTVQDQRAEPNGESIPTGGLEYYFHGLLEGKEGKRILMRSPRNAFETGMMLVTPQHGADIYLTINQNLQAIAEEEIERGVKQAKAKGGWAVMMDPHSGEVLALAQYPFFYPASYASFYKDPSKIEHTRVKAVSDAEEPGSVIKPITMTIGLLANEILKGHGEQPLWEPEAKMATSFGSFPGRSRPLADTRLHYFLNMDMAIQKSSNIYVARIIEKVVERFGPEWYREVMQDVFGFGEKTEIELPGESAGMLPSPNRRYANGTLQWSKPTPYSLAIGHNLQATSLQLLRAYAIFANGGYLVNPTLIRKIVREDEMLFENFKEEKKFPKVLNDRIIDRIVKAMKYTTKPGGTARRADIYGFSDTGKTSTAKKIVGGKYSETQYTAIFIGFAPVKHPAFVLLVHIDEPEYGFIPGVGKNHHGGTCAAPVFREIATRSLEYLGVAPDDPYGYVPGDPRYDRTKADWVPEVKQLQEMYESWNSNIPKHI